jgi:cyanophycinase-like exopeptidase
MIDFQLTEHIPLLAETIPAPVSAGGTNAGAEVFGDPITTHGVSGSRSPRRTASPSACALRNNPS